MFNEEDRLGDVNTIFWWIGWHPWMVSILGIPLVFLGGVVVWVNGLLYVNFTYESVRSDYVELVHERRSAFADNTDSDAGFYTLVGGASSRFWYSPPKNYRATHLVVGTTSVTIVRGLQMEMSTRMPAVRDDRREVFYDQISSVTYSQPHLMIKTSDGDTLRYVSGNKPEDALQDLQNRVRSYKQTA